MKRQWTRLMAVVASQASLRLAVGSARWVLTLRWHGPRGPIPAPAVEAVAVPTVSPDEIRLMAWNSLRREIPVPAPAPAASAPRKTTRAGESRLVADLARFRSGFTARKGALA